MAFLSELKEILKSHKKVPLESGGYEHTWKATSFQLKWSAVTAAIAVVALAWPAWSLFKEHVRSERAQERDLAKQEEKLFLPDTRRERDEALRQAAALKALRDDLESKLAFSTEQLNSVTSRAGVAESSLSKLDAVLSERDRQIHDLQNELARAQDRRKSKLVQEAREICSENESTLTAQLKSAEAACTEQMAELKRQIPSQQSEQVSLRMIESGATTTITFRQGDQFRRLDGKLLAVEKIDDSALHVRTDNLSRAINLNDDGSYGNIWGPGQCTIRVVRLLPNARPPSAVVEHWCK